MKKVVICLLLTAVIVSAQQKQRVAVLPSVGDLDPQRLILLTDKVREIATKNLPMKNFNILKQDVITKMIGEEELYRSCKEGVCIGDLAKKTNANYGARCDVIRLDDGLVLKFELYSVNEEAIFETFTDYDVKDFHGMLAVLDARLPDVFKKMVGALERAQARDKAREQQRSINQHPESVPIIAAAPPREITPSPYAAQEKKPRRKTSPAVITLRIAGAVAGGIGLIGGISAYDDVNKAQYDYRTAKNAPSAKKALEDIDSKVATRNTMYTVAGVGLAGFVVTLFF